MSVATASTDALSACGLTRAEQDVVAHLLEGASNAEIARRRGTSPRTVANQLACVFRKLGVSSRQEVALVALGTGEPGP
ncbi:MAG: response regulator transcription factor [Myxococcota bacterium]